MNTYEKDTTANAVVIYEYGNTVVENKGGNIHLKTTVYKKIKILNKNGEKHATVSILLYNNSKDDLEEKVKHLKAITYNINEPSVSLNPKHIYTTLINENQKEITFTFPNIKAGSVLEYQYDLYSDYFFTFSGWSFQSDIPKVKSEFHASIPGNWNYNRRLKGLLQLSKNEAILEKNCFHLRNYSADCEKLTYAMEDIPAFVEENEYSTTKNNYLAKIKFELAEIHYFDGTSKKYTTSWKETDKRLKNDENLGKQLKNKAFFSKNIPSKLFTIQDNLSRCKFIYKHIQNHYSLDEDNPSIFRNIHVKKAYKNTFGNFSEINLALISALNAAEIDAKIMVLGTRKKGFPTKLHPVMTDFNYLVAAVTINNKIYLLDASDKLLPFNMVPFEVLNSYGRVLDFENESYWQEIAPQIKTYERINATLSMDEDGLLNGSVKKIYNGYFSKFKKETIKNQSKENYISDLENENSNLEIISYNNEAIEELDKPFIENFEVEVKATELIGDKIYLNPFIDKYSKNPFQLEKRNYPVNFGYKINEMYMVKINIPENYIVNKTPADIAFRLPNKGGLFTVSYKKSGSVIIVFTKIKLNKTIYPTNEYVYLKEFFNQIIKTQNSLIVLEKKQQIDGKK